MNKNILYGFLFLLILGAGSFLFYIYYQENYIKLDKNLVHISVDTDYWTSQDVTVTVDYQNPDIEIDKYSFDGGQHWQKDNRFVVTENQTLEIVLRTKNKKKSEAISYRIDNIDKDAPEIVANQVLYVARGADFSFKNKYSVVETGSGIRGDITISPDHIDTSKFNTFEVEIKATDRAFNENTKKIIVEVVDPKDPVLDTTGTVKDVKVTGLTLSNTTISLVKGTSMKVSAKVKPSNATNQRVIWTTANDNVATVDSKGNIKGLTAGTTTITASTEDGSKSSTVRVIVTNEKILVTQVELDRKEDEVTSEHGNITLTATVKPDNATDTSIKWNSSNPNVAVVVNGVVTIRGEGKTTITATSSNGKTATYTLRVVDNYTFQEREVKDRDGEFVGYGIKIYKNGVDITNQVSSINSPFTARNAKKLNNLGDEIIITVANHKLLGKTITFTSGTKRHTAYR